jgi:hypothetical protein
MTQATPTQATSRPGLGHNGLTRDEWIRAILYGGQITRIGQHIALVIYHLTDPSTNIAKASLRDLERITGWSRTAIDDHIAEIELYIRITFGAGRAKATFELQGVISEAREDAVNRHLNVVSRQAATNVVASQKAGTADTKFSGSPDGHKNTVYRQPDTKLVAGEADTTVCGQPAGHKNEVQQNLVASQPDATQRSKQPLSILERKKEREKERETSPTSNYQNQRLSPDATFAGKALELFDEDLHAIRTTYWAISRIEDEIRRIDEALAREWDGKPTDSNTMPQRMSQLHERLGRINRKNEAELAQYREASMRKAAMNAVGNDCFFDEHRLMVANRFRAELLAIAGGDEKLMDACLIKAAVGVDINQRGPVLKKTVLGNFQRQIEWAAQNERATKAKEHKSELTLDEQRRLARYRGELR